MVMHDGNHATERHERKLRRPNTITLRVIRGPDAGRELTVAAEGRVLVGTSPTCALRLTDRRVSRRHLAIEHTPRGVLVRDLGSTNGTIVGGVELREAVVPVDVPVEIGDTQFVFGDAEEAPESAVEPVERFGRMIGRAPAMRRMFALAMGLARSEVNVLIEGETGAGKELLAEELHAHSARATGPLVSFDARYDDPASAAVVLFGAAPGAWPRAPEGRAGLLESANGGTIVIDEPAELPADLQRRLARILQRKETQRVGSTDATPLDVRVIVTTTTDLDRAVELGRFREDLFFALVGARIEVPPLRSRASDVPLLVRAMWPQDAQAEPSEALMARLVAQPWPGNVRELENAVARHLATGELDVWASARSSPPPPALDPPPVEFVREILAKQLPLVQARQEVVARFERLYVEQVLRECAGNVTRAARASGLAHRYFQMLKARRGFGAGT